MDLSFSFKSGWCVGCCGKSVGLAISADEDNAVGVLDYHEVARLRNVLGEWLDKVEKDGSYKVIKERYDEGE